jgi:hypothetical protein
MKAPPWGMKVALVSVELVVGFFVGPVVVGHRIRMIVRACTHKFESLSGFGGKADLIMTSRDPRPGIATQ